MRSSTLSIALCAALMSGACGTDEQPHAPTPVPTSTIIPAEVWDLETTLTSASGPACITEEYMVGVPSDRGRMQMRRDGSSILLLYGDAGEATELVGSIEGDTFTASSGSPVGVLFCEDAVVVSEWEARVAGSFSKDGRSLTARETWTYRLNSTTFELSFDWSADRLS